VRIRNSAFSLHIEISTQSLSADFHTSLATQLAVLLCAYACCFMTVYHSDPACTLQDHYIGSTHTTITLLSVSQEENRCTGQLEYRSPRRSTTSILHWHIFPSWSFSPSDLSS